LSLDDRNESSFVLLNVPSQELSDKYLFLATSVLKAQSNTFDQNGNSVLREL
jgi:hypothetical protein